MFAEELYAGEAIKKYSPFKLPDDIEREMVMSGVVKETYAVAWWAFNTTNNFEDCVVRAVNRGHDADTTGAVAGMSQADIMACLYQIILKKTLCFRCAV